MCAERQNHARELMKEYDLSTVDGIVIASGDGLLYEVQYYTVCVCPDPDPCDYTRW
jgi:diacylglycerol kinase family enzyme